MGKDDVNYNWGLSPNLLSDQRGGRGEAPIC